MGRTPHSLKIPKGEQWPIEIRHAGYTPLNLIVSESFSEINEQLTPLPIENTKSAQETSTNKSPVDEPIKIFTPQHPGNSSKFQAFLN